MCRFMNEFPFLPELHIKCDPIKIPTDAPWLTVDCAAEFCLPPIAHCQKPQATEILVLSQDALLLNNFPEGSEVTLECSRGYEKESGSGSIVCTNGKWSKPDLNCTSKCQLPLK